MNEVIEGIRLSPQQKRLWSLQQCSGAPAYRVQAVVRIDGCLDVDCLMTAINQVVQRHEILRTTFYCLAGMTIPLQVINERNDPLVTLRDLRDWESDKQDAEIENLFNQMRLAPFDLKRGPLLHVSLVKISAGRNILLVVLPAMNEDAAGLRNLVKEISHHYGAVVIGEHVAGEAMQYADSSEWHNDLLEAPERVDGRAYWREQGFWTSRFLELPFRTQNVEDPKFTPEAISTGLDVEVTAELERIAKKHNTAPSLVLLACWQVLAWRLTLHPQIVVGCAANGRAHEELKTALGLFETYLPAQSHLHEDLRFSELLKQLGRAMREGSEYQEYFTWTESSEREATEEERYFPLCYEYVEKAESYEAGGASFRIVREYACTERYELKLRLVRSPAALRAEFHYDASRYHEADVQRLAAQYRRLLTNVAGNEHAPVAELDMVSDCERQQFARWNETAVACEPAMSIRELFEQQAAARADATAIACGTVTLSYGELNRRANQLGHYLRRAGVGSEVLVALCVKRSPEMVIGVLGILKAGGAYLPLDPGYPAERLEMMVRDSGAEVLVTHGPTAEQLVADGVRVIRLDQEWTEVARESEANPPVEAAAENLAYVIYTSGSTGRPKGVGVTHGNLVHSTRAREIYYGRAPRRFLLLSSIAFDSSVAGLFWTLSGGGRLVLPEEGEQQEPRALVRLVQDQGITDLLCLPSLYAVMLEEGKGGELATLASVIVAGEVCVVGVVQRHAEVVPGAVLYNEYGPTEGSVWSTVQHCTADSNAVVVPIGRPIPNVRVHVLDQHMQVTPLGVPGELYIGGAGVTRGYLKGAELTAEKYVPDPFSREGGARLYRTGDVCRYQQSGELEFLGRVDGQVKIRGYRVEVGEIEAVLATHAAVTGAAVIVREGTGGEPQLVGYVTAKADREVSVHELRQWLGEQLPEYMVPARVVVLAEWPLMPNGKVDRRQLPAPAQVVSDVEWQEARTPVEEVLQSIWEEVLGVSELSVTANFFEVGGHSLLATQVMSRIREALQVELPVRTLFEQPTVARLAARVEAALRGERGVVAPPLERVSRKRELPLSFAQQRLWFLHCLEPGSAAYNMPAALRLTGDFNLPALHQSLNEIVRRHEILRTTFAAINGRPVQTVMETAELRLRVIDLQLLDHDARERQVVQLARVEADRPFDLMKPPLLRVTLVRLGEVEQVVLFTMHHIICDGWSVTLLMKEVMRLYEVYSGGNPSTLSELAIQYGDYAVWQRQWLQGEALEEKLKAWKRQFGDKPPALELPVDHQRKADVAERAATHELMLSQELTRALRALSQRESATLFMMMLAAFECLLHRYTGQEDMVVGTAIANRNRSEVEDLIGFFVNMLVTRTDLSGNPAFNDLLARVREASLAAYVLEDLPFEKLVEALRPDRNVAGTSLLKLVFVHQSIPMTSFSLAGLTFTPLELNSEMIHFDLMAEIVEREAGLIIRLTYNTSLFNPETIARLLTHYESLLQSVVAEPGQRLLDIPVLVSGGQGRPDVPSNLHHTYEQDHFAFGMD